MINYGAAIWGTQEYFYITAVYHRACRYFMGLEKYAPNIAIQRDMGLRVRKMYSSLGINHLCLLDQTVPQRAAHINVILKEHLEQE